MVDREQLVVSKGAQIQSNANINNAKNFHESLRGVYRPSRFSVYHVRTAGGDLIKNKELILA